MNGEALHVQAINSGLSSLKLVWQPLDVDVSEDRIERRSVLAGISGLGGDMRALHAAADADADARLAIAMFCTSAGKQIAAMCTVPGGIGENDETVRNAICARLACIGLTRHPVRVLRSQEDEQIARHTWTLLQDQGRGLLSSPPQ